MSAHKNLVAYLVYPGITLLELDASYGLLRAMTMGPWRLTTVAASWLTRPAKRLTAAGGSR